MTKEKKDSINDASEELKEKKVEAEVSSKDELNNQEEVNPDKESRQDNDKDQKKTEQEENSKEDKKIEQNNPELNEFIEKIKSYT
ncbi:hypothetical protein D6777_03620, partial [Candidatus Woesearchaeota archaeon]